MTTPFCESLTAIDDRLYFAAGTSVYISDGTAAGTSVLLVDENYYFVPIFTTYNGQVHFLDQSRIYTTQGTPETTQLLLDLPRLK